LFAKQFIPTIIQLKGIIMFRHSFKSKAARCIAVLTLICAFFSGTERVAVAGGQVPFHATYSLQLEADFSAFPLVGVTSQGSGLATQLGNIAAQSVSETVNLATGEGIAVYQFTAANGDTILISIHFLALPTSQTSFSVDGVWQIAGGTGRFAGASGGGAYHGAVQFISATGANGDFQLDGAISTVGSTN
jgi:hypothetical protein